ncbi:MAE_28990/MAE_18760 family HEPN-like nuclease [Macrococcoides caseolyticum]|uniref:MAE_28990/MAE_18760 family HEPN-like nuclease n=1 Tax=Macrococcoides caseolyticum TaxID=69966 RepID=UPI0010621319|nr:MAE_28990/MAE_18760 family HEPN-like nuclease [Macrococcus caseolyticus]TDM17092.1 hypothetical protein ETI00_05755 [Macrococcus caseolyticus]
MMNVENLQDKLNRNAVHRKKEINFLSFTIQSFDGDIKKAQLRSAFLILYAHYEGFSKEAVRLFLKFLNQQSIKVSELNLNLQSVYYTKRFIDINHSKYKRDYHHFLEHFIRNDEVFNLDINSKGIVVTDSNLKYDLLEDLLFMIGIDPKTFIFKQNQSLELKRTLIENVILDNRNKIAHGENISINYESFIDVKNFVIEYIDILSDKIIEIAMDKKYLS